MVYVKTIKRPRKDGSIREHYYLAENYRADNTIKTRIIRPLSKPEMQAFTEEKEQVSSQQEGKETDTKDLVQPSKENFVRQNILDLIQRALVNKVKHQRPLGWILDELLSLDSTITLEDLQHMEGYEKLAKLNNKRNGK